MAVTAIKIEPEIVTEIKIENDSLHIEQPLDLSAFDVKQESKEYQNSNSECYDNDHLCSDYDNNTNNSEAKLEESSNFSNEFEIGCTGQVANDNIKMIARKFNKDEQIDISDGTLCASSVHSGSSTQSPNFPLHKIMNHLRDKACVHRCHVCDFTTVHKTSLTRHLLLHSESMMRCGFCGKSFNRKLYLDAHLLSKHKNTMIALKMDLPFRTYNCNQCKYETVIRANLSCHKIRHEKPSNKLRPKNMCCDEYDYMTDRAFNLKEHEANIFDEFEPLRAYDQGRLLHIESHISGGLDQSMNRHGQGGGTGMIHGMMGTDFSGMTRPGTYILDSDGDVYVVKNDGRYDLRNRKRTYGGCLKTWTEDNLNLALSALKNRSMGLKRASITYGIPCTTLWQKAHGLGIDTSRKGCISRCWTKQNLKIALDTLKTGTISINKASKAYGIPPKILYKKAIREGIIHAASVHPSIPTWTYDDLKNALESIRTGRTSIPEAANEFGVSSATLYGRCKKDGIEFPRWGSPTTWSADAMEKAIKSVGLGHLSISQAAVRYNLPYSSLYARLKRGIKEDSDDTEASATSRIHDENLNKALEALRTGTISAGKASMIYGIPYHTLYCEAKHEGITLHNHIVTWKAESLKKALESIKAGRISVVKAATEFDIPRGTLYVECKKRGIKIVRTTRWSKDVMVKAIEAVGLGHLSIRRASIQYNLPYCALYERVRQSIKYDSDDIEASATYGTPSTALPQKARKICIDTPKKENLTKENLNNALEALRTGTISAIKASRVYGIPSHTLYKKAKREGITLAYHPVPTTWKPEFLKKALESIRTGRASVQKASTEFGIPRRTLYVKCKKEGINVRNSRWPTDDMGKAVEAVGLGRMSISQAAVHYNLPYSSLYRRYRRGRNKSR